MPEFKIMRLPAVKEATGLSTSSIWRLEKGGLFPKRFNISTRCVGWRSDEIETWINKSITQLKEI